MSACLRARSPTRALILEVLAGYDPRRSRYAAARGAGLSRRCGRRAADAAALRLRAHAGVGQGRRRDARGLRGARRRARRRVAGVDLPDALPRPGTIIASSWRPTWRTISAPWSRAAARASSEALRDYHRGRRAGDARVRYLAARDNARRYAARHRRHFREFDAHHHAGDRRRRAGGRGDRKPAVLHVVDADRVPAMSLPLLTGEAGMPLGLQLIGEPGDDARLLRTANWLRSGSPVDRPQASSRFRNATVRLQARSAAALS